MSYFAAFCVPLLYILCSFLWPFLRSFSSSCYQFFNYAVAWLQLAASISIFLLRLLSSFVCLCRICYPACVHLLTVLCQAFCVQSPEL